MIYIGNNEFRTAKSKIYLGNAGWDQVPLASEGHYTKVCDIRAPLKIAPTPALVAVVMPLA